MVLVFEMTDFVNDDVSDELRREMDEVEIERNMLVKSTTSPLGVSDSDDEFAISMTNQC